MRPIRARHRFAPQVTVVAPPCPCPQPGPPRCPARHHPRRGKRSGGHAQAACRPSKGAGCGLAWGVVSPPTTTRGWQTAGWPLRGSVKRADLLVTTPHGLLRPAWQPISGDTVKTLVCRSPGLVVVKTPHAWRQSQGARAHAQRHASMPRAPCRPWAVCRPGSEGRPRSVASYRPPPRGLGRCRSKCRPGQTEARMPKTVAISARATRGKQVVDAGVAGADPIAP